MFPPKAPGQCMTVGCNHDAAPGYDLCPACLGRNGGVTRPDLPARIPVFALPDEDDTQPVSITARGYDGNQDIPDFAGILAMDDGLSLSDDLVAIIVNALNTVSTLTEQVTEQDQVIRRQQAQLTSHRTHLSERASMIDDLTRQLVAEKSRVIGLEDQINGLARELAGYYLPGYIIPTGPGDTRLREAGYIFLRAIKDPDTGQDAFWLWRRPGARSNGHARHSA